ncbi:hypothetical protein OIU76_014505 [Salix suchowensis]|uniref:Uncharacterized protein n=1 Tax=Salix suchowensis TaxID=1278906 RepID=A0ABQ9A0B8_9ROSI|nr:proline-rich nuclear receptor coactivator [Salix suchowensis]KAJ6319188.1 hypothetical protein OIU76_014505 [Salix suchowensis]KAJ6321135.1 hypothetical protein OIU77_011271 [Salix suchowensis]
MGTEVLRPQGCLIERIRVSPCRRRNYYYGNGNGNFANPNVYSSDNHSNPRSNRKPSAVRSDRSDQRKKQSESLISKKSRSVDDIVKTYKNNSSSTNKVVEKVTILRRGESLDSKIKSSETAAATVSLKKEQGNDGDLVVASTDRLGPDPKMVSKHVRVVDLRSPVAGNCDMYAGSAFSVSPSPSSLPLPSFSKKKQLPIDDSATRDLRRLLRLDF